MARSMSSGTAPSLGASWWTANANGDSDGVASVFCSTVAEQSYYFGLTTSELRAEATRLMTTLPRSADAVELMLEMMRRLQAVDAEIAQWLANLPDSYRFRTLYWEPPLMTMPQRSSSSSACDTAFSTTSQFGGGGGGGGDDGNCGSAGADLSDTFSFNDPASAADQKQRAAAAAAAAATSLASPTSSQDLLAAYRAARVFPEGRVDVYPDFWVGAIWNTARVSRLILASLIMRCAAWMCAPCDYRTTAEYATARRTCEAAVDDIIASAPFYLGVGTAPALASAAATSPVWDGHGPCNEYGRFSTNYGQSKGLRSPMEELSPMNQFACGTAAGGLGAPDVDGSGVKGLAGLFITWPLTCVNAHDCTSETQRAYANGRLKFVAEELGIRYAHLLADTDIRFPSMMICRDGLMMSPDPLSQRTNKVLATRPAPVQTAKVNRYAMA